MPLDGRPLWSVSDRGWRVRLHIGIKQTPNHPLLLCVTLRRFKFKKINATLVQRKRYFHAFFTKGKLRRRRQKIPYDIDFAHRLICVSDFLCHKSVSIWAKNPDLISESYSVGVLNIVTSCPAFLANMRAVSIFESLEKIATKGLRT